MPKLLKLVDYCQRYSKPNQWHFQDRVWLKRSNFGGSCFPR